MKLSDHVEMYRCALEKTPFPNPDYRAENLKQKPLKNITKSTVLCIPAQQGEGLSSLVYSSPLKVITLVSLTYKLSNADQVQSLCSA